MSSDLPPADLIAFQALFKASKKSAQQAKSSKKCTHCGCNLFLLWINAWCFTCDICSASTCDDCTPARNADGKKSEHGKRICRVCMKGFIPIVSRGRSYDSVVKVSFLKDLFDRGWQVQMDPNAKVGLCTGIRVAPIGVFNVGKTWIINKLCESDKGILKLPSGTDVHTEGFSVKVATLGDSGKQCVFLDTAGLNSPVSSVTDVGRLLAATGDPMKAMENMLQELKRRESFIREVAFQFADAFLIVVGQITHRDQLDLLQILELTEVQSSRTGEKKKHVVVCHNLKSMSRKDLMQAPPGGGLSYFNQMRTLFQMTVKTHVEYINGEAKKVDTLHGMFGSSGTPIIVQHVFVTRHDPKDADCLNEYVFAVLRKLLASVLPSVFHPLDAVAECAEACVGHYLKFPLPVGHQMAVCYHNQAMQLKGGCLPAPVVAKGATSLAKNVDAKPDAEELFPSHDALREALSELKAEEEGPKPNAARVELLAARVYEETVKAATEHSKIRRDGSTLLRIEGGPKVKPVALGATSAHSGDDHVKYNVTRTRALYHGQPVWSTCIHLTLPGLAAGEVENIRRQLQWDEGLTFESRHFGGEDTLKLTFDTYILAMPAKQHATICQQLAAVGPRGEKPTALVDRNAEPEVVERGSRPFECSGAFGLTDKAYIRPSDGAFKLEVRIHTKVPMQCISEPPTLAYSRGILTVAIFVEPTGEDNVDTWSSEAVDLPATDVPEDANDL